MAANEIDSDLICNLTKATSIAKNMNAAANSTYDYVATRVRWLTLLLYTGAVNSVHGGGAG